MVYKLVSAASVEEKILQSAAQKLGLFFVFLSSLLWILATDPDRSFLVLALDHLVVEKMTTGMKASEIDQILRAGAQALFTEAVRFSSSYLLKNKSNQNHGFFITECTRRTCDI